MSNDLTIPTIDMSKRVIQGDLTKCVDGRWNNRDGTDMTGMRLLALSTTRVIQCWQDGMPTDTITEQPPGEELPDVADLNAKIPESEWEDGIDGKPRPPWQLQHVVYLLSPGSASLYTFINSTTGARIAVERLQDRVKWMRAMRGDNVVPLVELSSKPMKTQFGTKQRPEFAIVDWRELGGNGAIRQSNVPPTLPPPGKAVKPVTLAEELNDSLDHI